MKLVVRPSQHETLSLPTPFCNTEPASPGFAFAWTELHITLVSHLDVVSACRVLHQIQT